ncbi:hypothetical protein [Nocardia sp. NPDC050793]|uniref:hypothetical protein n=1 Tax=Nocardia sp. NPDC050793 TaxID=3155159 RepID=UPI0033C7D493
MTKPAVDRCAIAAEFEGARRRLHELVDSCTDEGFERPTHGTRWTNEQLLFHMVFGYPFFTPVMTIEDVYRYPVRHFDFHDRQLTIGG